ncbi:MAG: hypothetical protein QUS14_11330 [Pyrinomonadaceae bacterium]|nr:hypothetical protein [Pyrinomonadaceae bacterium]
MKRFRFIILGVVFSVIYLILAVGGSGLGHGTYIFFVPAWPYGLGLLVYPLLLHLVGIAETARDRLVFLVLILSHYGIIAYLLVQRWPAEADSIAKVWSVEPINIVLPAIWFLFGHLALWTAFFVKLVGSNPLVRPPR